MRKPVLSLVLAFSTLMILAPVSAAQTKRASVSAAEVNGTFEMNFKGKFQRMSNEIKIWALGGNKLKFAMDLVYPYTLRNGETTVNMGGLSGEMPIVGDTAVYRSEDGKCTIRLTFMRPGILKVKQDGSDGECGFGHNVFASGTYTKTSTRKPKFDE
jgi:hypothetical protein